MSTHPLQQVLQHLHAGRWNAAHDLVQHEGSMLAAWLHGILHVQEGDLEDAENWYDRAGRHFRSRGTLAQEIAAFEAALASSSPPDFEERPCPMTATLTYLFDPLCGWCYAAAPALARLQATAGVHVELAPTGLFAGGGARPMDAQFAAYAWSNDQRIEKLTGQPFTQAYRDRILGAAGGRFDSGPATLALTAVAQTAPDRELDVLHALQRARYVDGRDTADAQVLADVLTALGLAEAAAMVLSPDAALRGAVAERVVKAQAMMQSVGARGVPQLVVTGQGGALRLIGGDALLGAHEALLAEVLAG